MTHVLLTERLDPAHESARAPADARLVLPFELRQKSRLRARLEPDEDVGLVLERGTVLRGGDRLRANDGRVVEVVAAPEQVSVVEAAESWQLARAAYHLGNRHVPLQVAAGSLRYLHDHVLDDMLRGLGFTVRSALLPFEPEGGAYSTPHAATPAGGGHVHRPDGDDDDDVEDAHGHGRDRSHDDG